MKPEVIPSPAVRPIKLALLDYHTGLSCLTVQGVSSKEYTFTYNHEAERFIYETASQEDVDDLMRSNARYSFFVVSVMLEPESAAVTVTPPAEVEPASETTAERIAVLEADLANALTRIAHLQNPPPASPESKPAKRPYVRKAKPPTEG